MKILLADKQDITRAGLSYVISKMEGLETRTIEDKADLMLALKENEDTVVILDYTLFDINDAAELLILNQRFPYTRWLLFSVAVHNPKRISSLGLASFAFARHYLRNLV